MIILWMMDTKRKLSKLEKDILAGKDIKVEISGTKDKKVGSDLTFIYWEQ